MKISYKYLYYPLFVVFSLPCAAQNALSGAIKDANTQKPLAGATVYLPDLKTGVVSDSNGVYFIKSIPAGNYLVEVSLIGYATYAEIMEIKGALK